MESYDVVIIGGGPIGIACAIEAQKNNLSYVVIEKGTIANSIYHYPLYMQFFSTADLLEIDNIPFITTEKKPGRKDALEYFQAIVRTRKINIHLYEKMLLVQKSANGFKIATSKAEYEAQNVVIATGFYDIPKMMNVKGETLPKVRHYYTEPYPYTHQKVAVIGASNSAVDAALEIYRKGGDVTMLVRGGEINPRVKYWIKPDIENRIKEGSIKVFYHAMVTEITETKVKFLQNCDEHEIDNDYVLALTGYLPNFKMLEDMGIEVSGEAKVPVHNKETMETNVKGIYLAGVVCGGKETFLWFIENSRIHAKQIMENIVKVDVLK